jgi:hypothetical protein
MSNQFSIRSYRLILSILLSVWIAEGAIREAPGLLGATHMNPQYNFTTSPVLEEGADVLRHMGSRAIKLWYGPDYKTNFPQNHSWPTVNNLTELAQTDYFKTMFGDSNFQTYSLELATFDYRTAWKNGLVGYESNSISAEVYSFASHLLDTYDGSGKTFILQNWEGDNNLGENASAIKVQGMIDWMNCWQDAITAARNNASSSNVWVFGAAECNKVGQPNFEGPRMITDVFPYLRMDLYSYSDWYTRFNEGYLLEDLNNIKRYAPDSTTFGHENVMLGEFGLNRTANGEAGNLLSSQTEYEIGMDCGVRFAFYWCVYDTNRDKSHGLVLNNEHASWFDLAVDHTGRYFTQTHAYFKTNALTLDIFEDLGADFSSCAGTSNMMVTNDVVDEFDNDPTRFIRVNQNQPGILEYAFERDVHRLAVMGYEEPGRVTTVDVTASKTGAAGSYVDIPLRKVINDVYAGHTFHRALHKNVDPVPDGYRYFKVMVDSNVQRSPQLGSVRFYLNRSPAVQTIQFGGLVTDLDDVSHQTLIGADELVQWNGVGSWGGSFGFNGTLYDADTNSFLTSPATGLRFLVYSFESSDVAGTNMVTSGGVLGVRGGDNAKFDASKAEAFSFSFDRAVVLKKLILSALQYDGETAELSVLGTSRSFTRLDPAMEPAGWGANRYVYTFDPPLELAAGTDIQIGATHGQWGLEGVVVLAGALASPYDLWANIQGLEGAGADWFADPDSNGLNNQWDYALNGMVPTYGMENTGGSNVVEYVFQRRRDAAARGLTYNVEWTDNLVSNIWNSAGITEAGNEVIDAGFEVVTNRIPADLPSTFIHFEIEMAE